MRKSPSWKAFFAIPPPQKNGRILGSYVLYPVLTFTLNRKMMPLPLFDTDLNLVF